MSSCSNSVVVAAGRVGNAVDATGHAAITFSQQTSPAFTNAANTFAAETSPALANAADTFTAETSPALAEAVNTFNNETSPALSAASNSFSQEVAPAFGSVANTFNQDVSPAVVDASNAILQAVEMWTPAFSTFLEVLGPMQYLFALKKLTSLLQDWGVVPVYQNKKNLEALGKLNATFETFVEVYRESNVPDQVKKMTDASLVWHPETGVSEGWFFYTQNNYVVQQLQGMGYWAYDSVSELFGAVHAFNALGDAAEAVLDSHQVKYLTGFTKRSPFSNRSTRIYFLDLRSKNVIPHLEFPAMYQKVSIENHFLNRENLELQSVKVEAGCELNLQYISVGKLESSGVTRLKKCKVGWRQDVPPLFGGTPDTFCNPYNVWGNTLHVECNYARDEYVMQRIGGSGESNVIYSANEETMLGFGLMHVGGRRKERTISNLSGMDWQVRFEPTRGKIKMIAEQNGVSFTLEANPKSPTNKSFSANIPCGGFAKFVHSTVGGMVFGRLVFIDSLGDEYSHNYMASRDFTIIRPTVRLNSIHFDPSMLSSKPFAVDLVPK